MKRYPPGIPESPPDPWPTTTCTACDETGFVARDDPESPRCESDPDAVRCEACDGTGFVSVDDYPYNNPEDLYDDSPPTT